MNRGFMGYWLDPSGIYRSSGVHEIPVHVELRFETLCYLEGVWE